MFLESERRQVAAIGRRMSAEGLSNGTSGNLSIYVPKEGYMVLSPSGMRYEDIQPEDVVVMTLDGKVAAGERKPSSEWALHAGFYREKPEIRGVVHTHSPYCTTFAVLNEPIRAVHYAIAGAGTDEIPCAPYCTFGTGLLAERAVLYCAGGGTRSCWGTTAWSAAAQAWRRPMLSPETWNSRRGSSTRPAASGRPGC